MKPSDFTRHPFGSVLQNNESETVACNIMVILARTGNTFRILSWDEYRKEREKDGNFTMSEKTYFERVSGFCACAESALSFCKDWSKTQ